MHLPAYTTYTPQGISLAYRAELNHLRSWLPAPFLPRDFNGYGLITFQMSRVMGYHFEKPFPAMIPGSWRAAIRVPVEWDDWQGHHQGEYAPARFTGSPLFRFAYQRLFTNGPALGKFRMSDKCGEIRLKFQTREGKGLTLKARETRHFPMDSVLDNLDNAAWLYARPELVMHPLPSGSVFGTTLGRARDGIIQALNVHQLENDLLPSVFPMFDRGLAHFDHALLLSKVKEYWQPGEFMLQPKPLFVDPRFPEWQKEWSGNSDTELTNNRW